jgi:RNA polymerase sigma factor (sigma-70 family)
VAPSAFTSPANETPSQTRKLTLHSCAMVTAVRSSGARRGLRDARDVRHLCLRADRSAAGRARARCRRRADLPGRPRRGAPSTAARPGPRRRQSRGAAPAAADSRSSDVREALARAVAALPRVQREVVSLMKCEDLSVREVAARLGMTEAAVKATAHRGYKVLRASVGGVLVENRRAD